MEDKTDFFKFFILKMHTAIKKELLIEIDIKGFFLFIDTLWQFIQNELRINYLRRKISRNQLNCLLDL